MKSGELTTELLDNQLILLSVLFYLQTIQRQPTIKRIMLSKAHQSKVMCLIY
jgi:hypothetical protein